MNELSVSSQTLTWQCVKMVVSFAPNCKGKPLKGFIKEVMAKTSLLKWSLGPRMRGEMLTYE